MTPRTRVRLMALTPALLALIGRSSPAFAQDGWPARAVRLVVPFPPGGSSDILGRIVAENLARVLNVSMVVENKPGATTQIGTEFVANAVADGYTLLLAAATAFTVLPNQRSLPFGVDSFEIAGGVADYVAVMAVRKSLPVANMKEFVDYARRNPGKLSFGSAGELSAGHVFGGTLSRDTGIKVLHVPFRGSADAVNALVAGDIDFVIDGAATPMIKADRLRPLATFFRARHPELPDVPTLSEAGFEIAMSKSRGWGVLAPKGTPSAIVVRLSEALQVVLADPKVKEAIQRANSFAAYQAPAEFKAGLMADRKFYSELLPLIGVKN